MKQYLPGLREEGQEPNVTSFQSDRKPATFTAKWWMRPYLWIRRKPTSYTR